jgi:HSP20 family protein
MIPNLVRGEWPVAGFDDTFRRLRREFESAFGPGANLRQGHDGGFLSRAWTGVALGVWEDENNIYVEADLPGVAESDLDLTVHEGVLTVKGERKDEAGRAYLYNGRSFGRFERAITLPSEVANDEVHATLVNGVLRVVLAKAAEAKPRKITIRS